MSKKLKPQSLDQQLCTFREFALATQALKRSADEFAASLGLVALNSRQLDVVVSYVAEVDPRELAGRPDLEQMLSSLHAVAST